MTGRRLNKRPSWEAFSAACQLRCRFIMLGHGRFALFDECDAPIVVGREWMLAKTTASTVIDGTLKMMHRLIMSAPRHLEVDHINHNTLDNRRSNLRLCTSSQNKRNKRKIQNTRMRSQFKGVVYVTDRNEQWVASIYLPGNQRKWLGAYATEIEAAKAYNVAAVELFGEFACLNQLL